MTEKIEKDWTIMVYMAGDNNLSRDMVYALEQIKNAADQNDNINLLAYFDGYSSKVPTVYCDFTDCNSTNYYRSSGVKDKLIKRRQNNDFNENSASVNNVINFVDWCVNKVEHSVDGKIVRGRKAKNYAMIFSGHSFGFQSEGLFKDEKANYSMNLSRLRWMFERITLSQSDLEKLADLEQNWGDGNWDEDRIKERTTEIIGKPLTLLGFDSCVMSMLEVGCQFKGIAETMVASEGSIPNAGWSYAQILLGKIANDKNADARDIAASFVENFIRQQNKYALADISVDMAAWDLRNLNDLEKSFANFVKKLLDCFEDKDSVSSKQLKRIITHVHWQSQTYMYQQNIDLGDFCQLLLEEFASLKDEVHPAAIKPILKVEKACREVLKNIRACVILTGFNGGDYQFSNGISLFFPWSWSSYMVSRENYEDLSFVRKNDAGKLWNKFLFKYLSEITRRQAKPLSLVGKDGEIIPNTDGSIVFQPYEYLSETNGHLGTDIFAGTKIPENPNSKIPENPNSKIPENPNSKIPENPNSKIPENPNSKIPENPNSKIPENPNSKIPENPNSKIPENPNSKIPENPNSKIPENPNSKIPENPNSKMFSALNIFFPQFMETRNIESFWNRSGFISNQIPFGRGNEEDNPKKPNPANLSVTEDVVMELPANQNGHEKTENGSANGNSITVNLDSKSIVEAIKKPKKRKKAKSK